MLVDPAFVQLTEVGFREDGAAFGLVHSGAEQVFHIMNRNNHRRAGCVKGTEQCHKADESVLTESNFTVFGSGTKKAMYIQ